MKGRLMLVVVALDSSFFRLFSCFFQSLHCHLVFRQVYALLSLKFGNHPINDLVIEIIAAQMSITIGCQNFDNAVADFDDGNIECTAA